MKWPRWLRSTKEGGDTPIREARYAVVDTELTGLERDRDELLAVGGVRMQGTRILLGDSFYELVRPCDAVPRASVIVHRLTDDELAGARTPAEVRGDFNSWIGPDVLVGHCLGIDLHFLAGDLAQSRCLADTAATDRWLRDRAERFLGQKPSADSGGSLFELCRRYDIPVIQPHHALHDAFLTAQVWQRQLRELEEFGVRRIRDLPQPAF